MPAVFLGEGQTLEEAIASIPGAKLLDPPYQPGVYHPRVWRGEGSPSPASVWIPESLKASLHYDALVSAIVSATQLCDMFRVAAGVAEPSVANESCHGHALRHLLILASTDVEAGLKAVLGANEYAEPRLTTKDYVKLAAPMRLAEWSVRLKRYPAYPEVTPFANWSSDKPTQSLSWYAAYNETKHDRESSLPRATLGAVIQAIAAVHVMLCAQFGPEALVSTSFRADSVFNISRLPQWDPTELYFRTLGDEQWVPRPVLL